MPPIQQRKNGGFTLIELMLTVSVIGILAAVAIPQYNDYVIRTRVAEGLQLGAAAQKNVMDYRDRWGVFPQDNAAAGLPDPALLRGHWVSSIAVKDGALVVSYSNLSRELPSTAAVVMRPAVLRSQPGGPVVWLCQEAAAAPDWLTSPLEEPVTRLEPKYPPRSCRAS